ncbi:beta-glucan synthesis-associated [Meredithblackwellia eburnea MCA 4105]
MAGRRRSSQYSNPLPSPLNPTFSNSPLPPRRSSSNEDDASFESLRSPHHYSQSRRPSSSNQPQLDPASYGILTGQVGGSFGPFPRSQAYSPNGTLSYRDSIASSDVAIDIAPQLSYNYDSYNASHLGLGLASGSGGAYGGRRPSPPHVDDDYWDDDRRPLKERLADARKEIDPALFWDKENAEVDDYLHEPDPELDRYLDKQMSGYGWSNIVNTTALCCLIIVIVGLFGGWPIYNYVIKGGFPSGYTTDANSGLIPGQVPNITGLPGLIDATTPTDAYSRTGFDGNEYHLVFSDEFNTDGRTFWPGDDPWWEAVDLHYWQTKDLEWYDPDAIITKGGNLEITLSEEPINGLNFRSGMLQSWNKFCFTGGYIEVNVSLPGTPTAQGFWPGAWTQGNLGRAGYGGANDGVWPYSYDACDVGTLPNQTWPNGTDPYAAKHSGSTDYGGELSWLPGQRMSACTCPQDAAEHPGPNVNVGRGAPEIDIIEAQIDKSGVIGSASQSIQIAPFDAGYTWLNTTPYTLTWDTTKSIQNQWHGSVYQESMSINTQTDTTSYEGAGYSTFGFEYQTGGDGHITWAMNGTQTWQLNADAMGPNSETQISQRLVSEEPMYIVLNLAISLSFQQPEWGKLTFPGVYRVDYVRVYQTGETKIGCDPDDHPTSKYIQNHPDLYMNPNITVFSDSNYTYPRNSLSAAGCS